MPLYEYRCPTCETTYEKIVRMGASETPPCPGCGATNTKRLISAPARVSGGCSPSGST